MKILSYKGYQASVEFEDGALFVKVLHLDDLLIGQCDAASEVAGVLRDLVDDYLDDCRENGRAPSKPFKGSFNIRIPPEAHRSAAMAAAAQGTTLNAWIADAIERKLGSGGYDGPVRSPGQGARLSKAVSA